MAEVTEKRPVALRFPGLRVIYAFLL